MAKSLIHRADCHASGSAPKFAIVAIPGRIEPLNMCGHCLNRHAAKLREMEAVIELVAGHTAATGVGTESTPSHYAGESA